MHEQILMSSRVTRSSARLTTSSLDPPKPHGPLRPHSPPSSSSSSSRKRKSAPEPSPKLPKLQELPPSRSGYAKRIKSSRESVGESAPRQPKYFNTEMTVDALSSPSRRNSHQAMTQSDDDAAGSTAYRSVSPSAASETLLMPDTDAIEQLELDNEFKHSPLNLKSQQVRLLKLVPGREDKERIHAIIQHFDLSEAPPFKALSYTWGESRPLFPIYINGKSFSVRQNLFTFLETIGSDPEICADAWLWIDQVCIQQANEDERNHQVQQMAEIYRSASEVIVWLGPGTTYSKSLLQCAAEMKENPTSWSDLTRHVIVQLLGCEYWTRTWVIQEFILAPSLVLCWGTTKLGFDDLESILSIGGQHIRDRHCQVHSLSRKITQISELIHQKNISRHERFVIGNWKNALTLSSFTNCQDFRDRIYALLGLVDPKIAISPNYAASPKEIFVDVLASVAVQYANLQHEKGEQEDFLATKALVSRALGLGNRPLDELSDRFFDMLGNGKGILDYQKTIAKAADALQAWMLRDDYHVFDSPHSFQYRKSIKEVDLSYPSLYDYEWISGYEEYQ